MLRRYDERLATFAQTLNDAIAAFQAPPALASPSLEDDPEPMLRTLELARERTRADGAIALVTGGTGTPIVATVGLSESETNHIARMGFPDYRGARAIEVAFAGDLLAPDGRAAGARRPRAAVARRGRRPEPARRAHTREGAAFQRGGRGRARRRRPGRPLAGRPRAQPARAGRRARDRPPHEPPRPAVLHRRARARDRPRAPRGASALAPRAGRRPADEPQRAPRPRRRRRRAPRAREAPPGGDPPSRLHVPARWGPIRRAAARLRGRPGAGALRDASARTSRRARSWKGRSSRSRPAWPSS